MKANKYKIEFIFTEAPKYSDSYDISVKEFINITKEDAEAIGQKITNVKIKKV